MNTIKLGIKLGALAFIAHLTYDLIGKLTLRILEHITGESKQNASSKVTKMRKKEN